MLNKNSLAEDIRESMYMSAYNALMSTFKGEVTDEAADKAQEMCDKFATAFADTAKDTLVEAIHTYVNGLTINLSTAGPQTLIVTGASPAGPVTGTAVGPLVGTLTSLTKGIQ